VVHTVSAKHFVFLQKWEFDCAFPRYLLIQGASSRCGCWTNVCWKNCLEWSSFIKSTIAYRIKYIYFTTSGTKISWNFDLFILTEITVQPKYGSTHWKIYLFNFNFAWKFAQFWSFRWRPKIKSKIHLYRHADIGGNFSSSKSRMQPKCVGVYEITTH
jgi:hypothetical protein